MYMYTYICIYNMYIPPRATRNCSQLTYLWAPSGRPSSPRVSQSDGTVLFRSQSERVEYGNYELSCYR